MSGTPFIAAVLGHLEPERAAATAALPDLAGVLDGALAAARAAWPGVAVADERFGRQVAAAVACLDDVGFLPRLRFADLYLAAACADGDAAAVRILTARYGAELTAALRPLRLAQAHADEVIQRVWEHVLVGAGGPPRIADYRGRGDLRRWLRATALRAAYRLLEQSGRDVALADDDDLAESDGGPDPEIEYLKRRYATEFRDAFHAALAAVSPRERALLRRHYLDGLGVDELGALLGVHRATAARWVAEAREAVFDQTRRVLRERFGVADADLKSLIQLVRSRLDVSIERALATRDDGG